MSKTGLNLSHLERWKSLCFFAQKKLLFPDQKGYFYSSIKTTKCPTSFASCPDHSNNKLLVHVKSILLITLAKRDKSFIILSFVSILKNIIATKYSTNCTYLQIASL